VQGGGDVSKIIGAAAEANGVCLSCHAKDDEIRNWVAGPHASNSVRCIDCHQTHVYSKADKVAGVRFDLMAGGHSDSVDNLAPETKAIMQPRGGLPTTPVWAATRDSGGR